MQHIVPGKARTFKVLAKTSRSQVAEMVIQPGDHEGGPDNRHDSDQWLYVLSGTGVAIVGGRRKTLRPGQLLLIEKGEPHDIHCTGGSLMRSLNFYSPPAY